MLVATTSSLHLPLSRRLAPLPHHTDRPRSSLLVPLALEAPQYLPPVTIEALQSTSLAETTSEQPPDPDQPPGTDRSPAPDQAPASEQLSASRQSAFPDQPPDPNQLPDPDQLHDPDRVPDFGEDYNDGQAEKGCRSSLFKGFRFWVDPTATNRSELLGGLSRAGGKISTSHPNATHILVSALSYDTPAAKRKWKKIAKKVSKGDIRVLDVAWALKCLVSGHMIPDLDFAVPHCASSQGASSHGTSPHGGTSSHGVTPHSASPRDEALAHDDAPPHNTAPHNVAPPEVAPPKVAHPNVAPRDVTPDDVAAHDHGPSSDAAMTRQGTPSAATGVKGIGHTRKRRLDMNLTRLQRLKLVPRPKAGRDAILDEAYRSLIRQVTRRKKISPSIVQKVCC